MDEGDNMIKRCLRCKEKFETITGRDFCGFGCADESMSDSERVLALEEIKRLDESDEL